jgi:hypothetical protein
VNNLGNLFCWGQNQINRLECPYPIPVEDLYGWNINDIAPGYVPLLWIDYYTFAAHFEDFSSCSLLVRQKYTFDLVTTVILPTLDHTYRR